MRFPAKALRKGTEVNDSDRGLSGYDTKKGLGCRV